MAPSLPAPINADDLQRARRFYENVFGWRFESWGPPGFMLIHTGPPESPGIAGAPRRLLGSVSQALELHARCSVEIVRCPHGQTERGR